MTLSLRNVGWGIRGNAIVHKASLDFEAGLLIFTEN